MNPTTNYNPNLDNLNSGIANLNLQQQPSTLNQPIISTSGQNVLSETSVRTERVVTSNLPTTTLPMTTAATNVVTSPTFATTNTVVLPTVVKERVVNEVDVFPETVQVFERHVYPNPIVQVQEKLESVTEVEREIIHVHPVKHEKEIVHVHPSLIEKEVTHIQPITVHVQETVVHPEQVKREVEEKVLTTEVIQEHARDVLPTRVEYREEQLFAQDQEVIVTAPTTTITTPPVVPQTPVTETTTTTVTTVTETAALEKEHIHTDTTHKATGKKPGFLHRMLHPHEKI